MPTDSPDSTIEAQATDNNKNCARLHCKCPVKESGDYCSKECEVHQSEKYCSCGHPAICFLECDLVMKGGITSGIVYPPLVLKLKDYYHFRNVGGTSAGAIAAAVTAAAEYGRNSGGFEELERINNQLKDPAFLLGLFQPAGNARPLMETLLDLSKFHKDEKTKASWQSTFKRLRGYTSRLSKTLPQTNPTAYKTGAQSGLFYALLAALAISVVVYLIALAVSLLLAPDVSLRLSALTFVLTFLLFSMILVLPGYKFGGLAKGIYDLCLILFQKVPKNNFFGICNGRTDVKASNNQQGKQQEALTDWLHASINKLAGRTAEAAPLTFGELWEPRDEKGNKRIDLRMVTSNLSHNQPYVLPFAQNLFIFNKREFEILFPERVVTHMLEYQRSCIGFNLPDGYHFLPEAKDLPVVVATRMSLSFPLLISMVPLHTINHDAFGQREVRFDYEMEKERECIVLKELIESYGENGVNTYEKIKDDQWPTIAKEHLKPNWFSDGGICSNFPMHFFDAWLPSRPTFGINLTSQMAEDPALSIPLMDIVTGGVGSEKVDKERFSYCVQQTSQPLTPLAGDEGVYDAEVYLPRPDNDPSPEWIPINTLGAFLGSIFTTAQNYRDNMQAALPSYRERIVQIRLTPQEGGLNLEMDSRTIQRVFEKGQHAGDLLLNRFEFDVHQWVRFRVLMNQIEKGLNKMSLVLNDSTFYLEALEDKADPTRASQFPYGRKSDWCSDAKARLEAMNLIMAGGKKLAPPILFEEDSPLPEPVLRVTPEL